MSLLLLRCDKYYKKYQKYGAVAHFPLWETSGTAAHCLINPAQNGTYNSDVSGWPPGPGIGDGATAPFFDGANDCVDIDSPALRAAIDSKEGTLSCWARVFNAGVWTDGAFRAFVYIRDADYLNLVRIIKTNFDSHVSWNHIGAGTNRQYWPPGALTVGTSWHHWAWTWSQVGRDCHAYLDGGLHGSAGDAPVTWGAMPTFWAIGAQDTGPMTNVWHGWLAHVAFWDKALTQPQIADLAST